MKKTTPERQLVLADYVAVESAFARSVHAEADFAAEARPEYHITPCAREALRAASIALEVSSERAMTLIGPYGAGKSAFCVFLARVLSGDRLSVGASLDMNALPEKALVPILIVGSRRPLGNVLVSGLMRGLEAAGLPRLTRWLREERADIISEGRPSERQVVELYRAALSRMSRHRKGGLLLIVDELGKLLEFAAQYPKLSDIFVLQELAEFAARSAETPLVFLGVLHQSAEEYARHLGRTQQAEWVKVSERFKQVPFFPQDTEQIDLVGRALKQERPIKLPRHVRDLCGEIQSAELTPPSLNGRFTEAVGAAYPLHPMTLLALPVLFRRAAQSHRSLFNFLAGHETHALSRYLSETEFDHHCPPLFTLDSLFDYAIEVVLGAGASPIFSQEWADAIEAVDQAAGRVPEDALRALKVVALLGVVREQRLRASAQVVKLALTSADGTAPDTDELLKQLRERHLISYSRHADRYRLWEGGDVDVEGELEAARRGVAASAATQAALQLHPPSRLIARRHSYETGTLRGINALTCAASEIETFLANARDGLTLLYCLASSEEDADAAEAKVAMLSEPHVLVAIGNETDALQDAATDLVAADTVRETNRELTGDRAAQRHLEARRTEAREAFFREWRRIFGPGGEASWWYQGERIAIGSPRQFSERLSIVADNSYSKAPVIQNELVNRQTLSSAAAKGRRNLIERMLMHAGEPCLGIEKFPPERSMYESVLKRTGIHQELEPGQGGFSAPPRRDPSHLRPAWDALERAVFADPPEPRPVTDLFGLLKERPYGLTDGVLPILLCAFLQVHDQEATLYREGTFMPEPRIADWEVLIRRPEQFAVAGCRVKGERAAVVTRIAVGVGVPPSAVPVVRALINMVKQLPEFAQKTRSLPAQTLALREAIRTARSPERLLFHDLPIALDLPAFGQSRVSKRRVESFFDRLNAALQSWSAATPTMIKQARDQLVQACGFKRGAAGWSSLRKWAADSEGVVVDARLAPFVQRAAISGDDQTVLEGVLALVANRPPRFWADADVEHFPQRARAFGSLVQQSRGIGLASVTASLAHPKLSSVEEELRSELANEMRKVLGGKRSKPTPNHVIRAALLSLLEQYNAISSGDDPECE